MTAENFEPRWVTEIDVSDSFTDLTAPERTGKPYKWARALLRDGSEPLVFIDLALDEDGVIKGPDLERVVGEKLARHRGPAKQPGAEPEQPGLITVVICTHDRPELIGVAIDSILGGDDDDFELLIVDNAPSSDATAQVVASREHERLRYVVEPLASLSRARNRGALEARGEFIAFTDDDVRIDPQWLRALRRGFARAPHVGLVSGLVPALELETPAQLYFDRRVNWSSWLEPVLFDMDAHKSSDPMYPYSAGRFGTGANFATRRDVWLEIGGNDEVLGPGVMGEDLDYFLRVILNGNAIAYEPSAIVWHVHRRDTDGLKRQMRQYGVALGAYTTKHILSRNGPRIIARVPRALMRIRRDSKRAVEATEENVDLRRLELYGLVQGPWRYLARRLSRKVRRKRSLI